MRARAGSIEEGNCVIVMGITRQNVERLLAGQPIRVTGASVGEPQLKAVVVFYGETEGEIVSMMKKHGFIDDETTVHIDIPKTNAQPH